MSVSQQQKQIPLTRHEGTFIVTNGGRDVSSRDIRNSGGREKENQDRPLPNTAKLSVLQKAIMETAYRWHGTFYAADIKAEIFHWPVTYVTRHKDPET